MKAILTYHSVDESGSTISVRAAAFRQHVEWLAEHGPPVVAVDELRRLPASSDAVAITFDDAYENFATDAWPVLRDHGMPATVFVPTHHVGGLNTWDAAGGAMPRLELMQWPLLGRLVEEGVTLGSHSDTHPRLTQLSAARVADELRISREILERETGTRPVGLAYPYGDVDDAVVLAAAEYYQYACTTELRVLGAADEPHRLPRLDMYYLRHGHALTGWGTSSMRLYLLGRAGARRCRQLLARAGG